MGRSSQVYKMIPFGQWILRIVLNLIGLFLISSILKYEHNKRTGTNILFINKYIKVLPLLCMINGVIIELFDMLHYIPILCHFSFSIHSISVTQQPIFIGFFQLFRLHYTFAQSQVHSNKGYSQNTFTVMYIIGTIMLFYGIIMAFPDFTLSKCGWDGNHDFYEHKWNPLNIMHTKSMRTGIAGIVFTLWDLTTLSMYIYKVRSFKIITSESTIHNRIEYILNRIILLTVLYEIPLLVMTSTYVISAIFNLNKNGLHALNWIFLVCRVMASVFISFSSFLMQEHNSKEYMYFLRIISECKVHYIFRCCKSMIENGLDYNKIHIEETMVNRQKTIEVSHSGVDTKIEQIKVVELSLETTVQS
eukprot:365399_1